MRRYHSIAVSLHWLIALLIAGLIILAKIAHDLPDDNPLRFELIQWHKSFGIALLLLVAFRVLWRLTHRPPPLPVSTKKIERFAASAAHIMLYGLMIALPLTGWAMVSASSLNLATEMFGLIPWPHLPWLTNIADRDVWQYRFHNLHYWLANGMMALVLVHALAALRHQFVLKDGVLSRMAIGSKIDTAGGFFIGTVIGAAGVIGLINLVDSHNRMLQAVAVTNTDSVAYTAKASTVTFAASQMGDPINGVFAEHRITLELDDNNLAAARLIAMVSTASVDTGDGQIDATVVTEDWFSSQQFPNALFKSSAIELTEPDVYAVAGVLTIRGQSNDVSFQMNRQGNTFSGSFSIDRTAYGVGVGGQDKFVAPAVTIGFEVTP